VETLGQLEKLTEEELASIIPDPSVVQTLRQSLDSEVSRRRTDEAWVQNLLVDNNL